MFSIDSGRQVIEHVDAVAARQQLLGEVRADEAGAAGDEETAARRVSLRAPVENGRDPGCIRRTGLGCAPSRYEIVVFKSHLAPAVVAFVNDATGGLERRASRNEGRIIVSS